MDLSMVAKCNVAEKSTRDRFLRSATDEKSVRYSRNDDVEKEMTAQLFNLLIKPLFLREKLRALCGKTALVFQPYAFSFF